MSVNRKLLISGFLLFFLLSLTWASEKNPSQSSIEIDALFLGPKAENKDDFLNSDGIVAGFPVYVGVMAADLKRVFDEFASVRKKMENKAGDAFATSGEPTGGKETTMISIIQCLPIYGMIVAGDPLDATGHYGAACVGTSDDKAAANGEKLGRRVTELCRKLTS